MRIKRRNFHSGNGKSSRARILSFKEPKNRFQGNDNLAGRYANPIPTRFLAPIDCIKIPAQWLILKFGFSFPVILQNTSDIVFTLEMPQSILLKVWSSSSMDPDVWTNTTFRPLWSRETAALIYNFLPSLSIFFLYQFLILLSSYIYTVVISLCLCASFANLYFSTKYFLFYVTLLEICLIFIL